MPKTRIAREVDEILASAKTRQGSANDSRGAEAFRNIQHEARAAESEAHMADNTRAVAAQQSSQYAHGLVEQSKLHADQAARFVELAQAWVREAQGTPQFESVERVLGSVRSTAARAKARAAATKKVFEKRFGKYDPRGVLGHATVKKRRGA